MARRPDDDELPPDPWAGFTPPPTGHPDAPSSSVPSWAEHPAGASWRRPEGHDAGHPNAPIGPQRGGGIWQHPAVWIGVVVVAVLLLVTAVLDRPSVRDAPPADQPTPSVTAAPEPG